MKKKLIIIEPECKSPSGHGLISLEQYYLFLKKNKNIICIANKKLNKKFFFCKKKIINHFVIGEEYFKIKKFIDFLYIVPKFIFFISKCSFLIFNIILDRKLKYFLNCFFLNSFKIPRYFPELIRILKKLNLNKNDDIFFPSGRPISLQALYFLIEVYPEYFPKVHFRIVHPIKNRGKKDNFYKYLNIFIKKNLIESKIFFYAENLYYKKTLEKYHNLKTVIFNGLHYIKNNKKFKKKVTIGFLGDSKKFKGFDKIPNIINKIQNKKMKVDFIIQINNPQKELQSSIKKIELMSKVHKNILIYYGKINNKLFHKLLNKINIIPLMYKKNRAKTFGSGFIYTAIGSGICLIIPTNIENWKKNINGKSYLEADSQIDYVKKLVFMIKKFKLFNKLAIRTKQNYYNDLNKNPLIQRLRS